MKLFFRQAKPNRPVWHWYWQVDGSHSLWYDYKPDETPGTLAWLRSYVK